MAYATTHSNVSNRSLDQRKQVCMLNNCTSDIETIRCGVPQGGRDKTRIRMARIRIRTAPTSYPGLFASAVGWSAKKALASAGLFCKLISQ